MKDSTPVTKLGWKDETKSNILPPVSRVSFPAIEPKTGSQCKVQTVVTNDLALAGLQVGLNDSDNRDTSDTQIANSGGQKHHVDQELRESFPYPGGNEYPFGAGGSNDMTSAEGKRKKKRKKRRKGDTETLNENGTCDKEAIIEGKDSLNDTPADTGVNNVTDSFPRWTGLDEGESERTKKRKKKRRYSRRDDTKDGRNENSLLHLDEDIAGVL